MFGPLSRELALARPVLPERWLSVARPVLSSTAGILLGALLVGVAAVRLAPEPAVTPATQEQVSILPAVPLPVASAEVAVASAPASPAATTAPVAAPPAAAPASAPPAPSISATPYRSGGRAYAAVSASVGTTLDSPLAGRVEVRLYQLVNGQIRTGANVAGLAYFPYVVVRASDRVLTLRPGVLDVDSEILVRDGSSVTAGTPLLRVTGDGPSSWQTFYDRALGAQVVASLTSAAGADLDAVALFARH